MRASFFIFVVIALLGSCSDGQEISLPASTYSNITFEEDTPTEKFLTLTQVGQDSVRVEYDNSIVVSIDSNLHYNAGEIISESRELHSTNRHRVKMFFNASCDYHKIHLVQKELRKVGEFKHLFMYNDHDGVQIMAHPLCKADKPYLNPKSEFSKFPYTPACPPDIDSVLATENGILIRASNGEIKLFNQKHLIADLDSVLLTNKDYVAVYDWTSSNTLQDYIDATCYLFSSVDRLRQNAREKEGLSEEELRKRFPKRMTERKLATTKAKANGG